jgi:hypothetical protein
MRRRGEDGMALLLVLMLIVMVTAADVFASQSTALEVKSSGYTRQAAQTHYVAETGVVTTLELMSRLCTAYVGEMRRRNLAPGAPPPPPGLAEAPLQYAFYSTDFDAAGSGNTSRLFEPASAGMGGLRVEGSLGTGLLTAGFVTTATVVGQASVPMFGFPGGGSFEILNIEFSSNGRTQLSNVTTVMDPRQTSVGTEGARVIAQIPCL